MTGTAILLGLDAEGNLTKVYVGNDLTVGGAGLVTNTVSADVPRDITVTTINDGQPTGIGFLTAAQGIGIRIKYCTGSGGNRICTPPPPPY
jgi:hypothetical protein